MAAFEAPCLSFPSLSRSLSLSLPLPLALAPFPIPAFSLARPLYHPSSPALVEASLGHVKGWFQFGASTCEVFRIRGLGAQGFKIVGNLEALQRDPGT